MVFLDVLTGVCTGQPSPFVGTSILTGSLPAPSCEWVPAIAIDECQLVGGHITDLVYNDVELGALSASLCASVSTYTQVLRSTLNSNFSNVTVDFQLLEDEIELTLEALLLCFNTELMHVWTRLDVYRNEMDVALEDLVNEINLALALCCPLVELGVPISPIDIPSQGAHDYPDPCLIDFNGITPFYNDFPEIPCDSCPPIEIWTPCSQKNSISITGGCDPKAPAVPQNSDECQSTAKKTNAFTGGNGEKGRLTEDGPGPRLPGVPQPEIRFEGAGFIGPGE